MVGIYEPNNELAKKLVKQFGLDASFIYNDLGKMLDAVKPVAVAAFGSIYEHMKVVEAAAPRHIDVIVEKPWLLHCNRPYKWKRWQKNTTSGC